MALSAVCGALLIDKHGWGMWESALMMLGIGAVAGLINGFDHHAWKDSIAYRHTRTMQIYRGAVQISSAS
ncbi:MAG: hypothetical protein R2848_03655 [Thermomicrobiales bacterium]